MMSEKHTHILEEFKSLNQRIDRVYEEKVSLINDALSDIKDKFGYLIDDDDFDSKEINELLKPKMVTPKFEHTPAKDIQLNKTRVQSNRNTKIVDKVRISDISASSYKSLSENTSRSFADDEGTFVSIEDRNDAKKTPLKTEIVYFKFDHVNRLQPTLKNEQFAEFSITLSKPNTSIIRSSIDTVDIECPLGSSTPEDFKLKKFLTQPKFEVAKKNKPVSVNAAVEPKKRKREVLKQKAPAVELKLKESQARIKRQVVLKYEKKKLEEKSRQGATKLVKQKELKCKNTPKMFNSKNMLKIGKAEDPLKTKKEKDIVEEYNIDHVIEGASSEEEDEPKNQIPKWATPEGRENPANVQAWLDKQETVYVWFFNEKLKTPNLEELFSSGIKTRSRTSSAVWHRPI